MTRVTFSADRNALNFDFPTGWEELSQGELAMVMRCKARQNDPYQAKLAVLLHLTDLKVIRRESDQWLCAVPAGEKKPHRFLLDSETLSELLDGLNWIEDPGSVPVRLDRLHGATALQAKLHGVAFTAYLQCENCYQGILQNHSEAAVQHLANLLYDGLTTKLTIAEQLMVIMWWTQVKTMFAALFPNFFKPNDSTGDTDMTEVMNNQIRALTGGDVTKEEEILGIDTWRALTELDAKAKEADEFNAKMKKK